MNKEIPILIVIIFAFVCESIFAQGMVYGEKFEITGCTFIADDGIKRTEVIFINSSKCIIKQKYYDPEIAKDYSFVSEFKYKKKWKSEKIKFINDKYIDHNYYKITLYPCSRHRVSKEPFIKLSDYALQRLNFSFCSKHRNDYYPDGERKKCINYIDDRWDYTPAKESDGYILNPSSVQNVIVCRFNYQEDGIFCGLWFPDATFTNRRLALTDSINDNRDRKNCKCSLAGKTYVIYDPYRMERFAFMNDSLCTYSQFIPMEGDTIEVKQSCKYKQDGYYVTLASYSGTLTDSILFALNDNQDVCISCDEEEVRCFPASYVYYINVIDSDTLTIDEDVIEYSKVFHFPDHNPIHFCRAYYPTTGNMYRLDDIPSKPSHREMTQRQNLNGIVLNPYKWRHIINFGNARVPANK